MARIDRRKIAHEISLKIKRDPEIPRRTKQVAEEVARYWANVAWPTSVGNYGPGVHPYETGGYRESIGVRQPRSRLGRFIAGWEAFSDHPRANFIEFGTGDDKPGSKSPWGPYTKTPEFAPAARTAHHFGGTSP